MNNVLITLALFAAPLEVESIATELDTIHRENWPQAQQKIGPKKFVDDVMSNSDREKRLGVVRNGVLCTWIAGLDLVASVMFVSLAHARALSQDTVTRLAERIGRQRSDLVAAWDRYCDDRGPGGPGKTANAEWNNIAVSWDSVLGVHPGMSVHRGAIEPILRSYAEYYMNEKMRQVDAAIWAGLACAPAVCPPSSPRPSPREALIAGAIFSLGLAPAPTAVSWPILLKLAEQAR